MLRRRREYDENLARADARKVCERIAGHPWWSRADCVMLYMPIRGEVNVRPLMELALEQGKRVVLPRCKENSYLSLHFVARPDEELCAGSFGILEPQTDLAQADPRRLQFIVAPGLAFDRLGNRIGYGKGYYDRLLAALPIGCHIVAAAYDFQLITALPPAPHDRPMDAVVTPSGWWNTQRGEDNEEPND